MSNVFDTIKEVPLAGYLLLITKKVIYGKKTPNLRHEATQYEAENRLDDQSFLIKEIPEKSASHPAVEFIMKRMLTVV